MAWKLLFGSDIGLLSLFVIVFTLLMGFWYIWFLGKKSSEGDK